jgi:hypothetical protein
MVESTKTKLSSEEFDQLLSQATVNVTEKEQELFDLLLRIVREKQLKTTLRVAGGWVRDKVSHPKLNR